jgi:chemotaxis protein methyltransferase CheR
VFESQRNRIIREKRKISFETGRDADTDERFHGLSFTGRKSDFPSRPYKPKSRKASLPPVHIPIPGREVAYTMEQIVFVQTVLSLMDLNASAYRLPPLIRRIPACLRALKTACVEMALHLIQESRESLHLAANALLIGTTTFFRDPAVFDMLKQKVIPELLRHTASPAILSAACSGGEELYSTALLFSRHPEFEQVRFLGIDCRPEVLQKASHGKYPAHLADSIPKDLLESHWTTGKTTITLREELRSRMEWQCQDVLSCQYPPNTWNMVLCRNLAIYLEPNVAHHLWRNLTLGLKPNGFLVVGRAEKPTLQNLTRIGPCIYQKSESPA